MNETKKDRSLPPGQGAPPGKAKKPAWMFYVCGNGGALDRAHARARDGSSLNLKQWIIAFGQIERCRALGKKDIDALARTAWDELVTAEVFPCEDSARLVSTANRVRANAWLESEGLPVFEAKGKKGAVPSRTQFDLSAPVPVPPVSRPVFKPMARAPTWPPPAPPAAPKPVVEIRPPPPSPPAPPKPLRPLPELPRRRWPRDPLTPERIELAQQRLQEVIENVHLQRLHAAIARVRGCVSLTAIEPVLPVTVSASVSLRPLPVVAGRSLPVLAFMPGQSSARFMLARAIRRARPLEGARDVQVPVRARTNAHRLRPRLAFLANIRPPPSAPAEVPVRKRKATPRVSRPRAPLTPTQSMPVPPPTAAVPVRITPRPTTAVDDAVMIALRALATYNDGAYVVALPCDLGARASHIKAATMLAPQATIEEVSDAFDHLIITCDVVDLRHTSDGRQRYEVSISLMTRFLPWRPW